MGLHIYSNGDVTITGPGKLTLVGANYYGGLMMGSGDLTLKDLDLTVQTENTGIRGSGSWSPGKLTIDSSRVQAGVNTTWNSPIDGFENGVELKNCIIITPEDGTVKDGTVVNGDGTLPDAVLIQPAAMITVSGSTLTYRLFLPGGAEPAALIAVWYDGDGRLLGCTVEKNVKQDGPKPGMIEVEKDQKEYRLFVLDWDGRPLTSAFSLKG